MSRKALGASRGMTKAEAEQYVRDHPDEKCYRCKCSLPKSEGDDGIHEVLLGVCVDCMKRDNEELRGERSELLGDWCITNNGPADDSDVEVAQDVVTELQRFSELMSNLEADDKPGDSQ